LTVGVNVVARKREKGPKGPSFSTRKSRRGQRGGRKVLSAVDSAARPSPRPSPAISKISRRLNHSGRKHWWTVKAANKLAARKDVQQFVREMPWDFGHLSRTQARRLTTALAIGSPHWVRFRDAWHVYSYRARHIGARPEGRDPLHFLALRSPKAGGADLEELISFLPQRPQPVDQQMSRFCRHTGCGVRFFGTPDAHSHCRHCEYVGPRSGHSEELCWQILCLQQTLVQGSASIRRRGYRARYSR
jgi:hypothetical protein